MTDRPSGPTTSPSHRHPRRRRWAMPIAALVAVTALAAGCGDDGDGEEPSGPDAAVLPLLGQPGDVPAQAALAVKIDNSPPARPQTGLDRADVVFEEVVEGGLTRLLAVYQSRDPETVGPVRSARSTDLPILAELGRPLFAWSGANATVLSAVDSADLIDVGVTADPDAYRRDGDRTAPYDLMASGSALRSAAEDRDADAAGAPPSPIFDYRSEGAPVTDLPGAEPATSLRSRRTAELSTDIAWDWDPDRGAWVRTQNGTAHVDAAGDPLTAVNVIVRATPYQDSGQRDARGAVVPEAEAVGEGDAWLLSDGHVVPGRWQKASAGAPTTYTTTDGSPLELTPGNTWVEILPPDGADIS